MSLTTAHAAMPCPVCAAQLNRATSVGAPAPPDDGDLTICGHCGVMLIYVGTPVPVALRLATQAEIDAYVTERPVLVQEAIRLVEQGKVRP